MGGALNLRASLLAALSSQEQRAAQKAAGDFLRDLAEAGRSAELGLSRLDVLLEARGHYLAAEDLNNAIAVTARISGYLQRRGYYSELIRLNQELLDLDRQSCRAHDLDRPRPIWIRANTEKRPNGTGGPCRSPRTLPPSTAWARLSCTRKNMTWQERACKRLRMRFMQQATCPGKRPA